jgi:V/A-type H+-transporting ATPase subunit D
VRIRNRSLMGVALQDATLDAAAAPAEPAVNRSPEAEACRQAFAALLAAATALAGVAGNLERLSFEYRRSVRRARALQDVMLPELDRTIGEIDSRLEELEREDAIWMRAGAMR